MTELRQRMIEDMKLHDYAENTQDGYMKAVKRLAEHYNRPPDQLSEEEIRQFFLYLIDEKGLAKGTIQVYLSGIRFFYETTLGQNLPIFQLICSKKKRRLPDCSQP